MKAFFHKIINRWSPEERAKRRQAAREAKKQKLEKTLAKSALDFTSDIKKLAHKYQEPSTELFQNLEESLIRSDMGMSLVLSISQKVQHAVQKGARWEQALQNEIYNLYRVKQDETELNFKPGRLNIFMVVGVNGTGKTTSLVKLANYYAQSGEKVMIIAGDTFRAGAAEQLEQWQEKRSTSPVTIVRGRDKQDPSSVIYDGLKRAQNEDYDLVLIDTAGRLQNKINLMKELQKMHQTVSKFVPKAPHEVLITIDATTGQNGLIQATEFNEITRLSGIILTKMDGTSKGGIALAIKNNLNLPIKFIGIGEQIDDLVEFNIDSYVRSFVGPLKTEVQN